MKQVSFAFLFAALAAGPAALRAQDSVASHADTGAYRTLFLKPVEVTAIRAGDKAPFPHTDLSRATLDKINTGVDIPFLLNQTPSVVANSDAGNGVGYTGISIRGSDATRINVTMNGLPYNDAESQGVFFVDLPDLSSSVQSVQVQRGVGTSSNGAGAFGATINFSTNEYSEKPYAEFSNGFGSYSTWKNTVRAGTGLLNGHFTADLRLSRISSNGYIDRASSDLKSFYFSTAWLAAKSSVRLNVLSGAEQTYQAWNGVPEAKLYGDRAALDEHYADNVGSLYNTTADSLNLYNSNPRKYNYFTYPNQIDKYRQDHYQLFYNQELTTSLALNVAGFLTRGLGYYEEYKANQAYADYGLPSPVFGGDTIPATDLIRRKWLDNYFYGGIFSLQYEKGKTRLTLGGGWDRYNGEHYGRIIWAQEGGIAPDQTYYHEPADKNDLNLYAKWQQQLGLYWTLFADLQYRHIRYTIDGFDDNPGLISDNRYDFLNPKGGITYSRGPWQVFASYSAASHEPNRDDFETGAGQRVKPEKLGDFELGLRRRTQVFQWGLTGYYMRYRNQLALTGQINDVGAYTRTNVPRSYRLGVEAELAWKPVRWFSAEGNFTLSRNRISDFTEYIDDYDNGGQKTNLYASTPIALSPDIVGAYTLHFYPLRDLELALPAKYVGREYLDNTGHQSRSIADHFTQDFRVTYTIRGRALREASLIVQVNNIFDKRYEANGYTYNYLYGGKLIVENFLFPMAGTNLMTTLRVKF